MTDVLGVNDGQEAPVATKKPKTASRQPPARRTTKPTDAQAYYMRIADAVRQKASCDKRLVGAVIVLGNRIVSTGYNGTPEDMPNCNAGGCYRCAHPEQYGKGKGYDVCICVHAEQNALLTAARFGIGVEGADLGPGRRACGQAWSSGTSTSWAARALKTSFAWAGPMRLPSH